MRILSRYFATRFLGLFVMVLAASLLVLATLELVLNLEDVTGWGGSAGEAPRDGLSALSTLSDAARALALRLTSYYLADVLPIASFIAVFTLFALSGRAMELVAIQAGGVRPARIILPVLTTALILSLASVVLHETLILRADRVWSRAESDVPIEAEIDFAQRAFWVQKGPLITNVGYADPETRTLHDVEIFERSQLGAVLRVIRTAKVAIEPSGAWRIDRGTIWRFDPIDFTADPEVDRDVPLLLDHEALQADLLVAADPALLPLQDLAAYLEDAPRATSSSLRRVERRLHERLANPWLVLVFAWLAMPFAMRVDSRGRIATPAVGAALTLSLFYVVQSAGQTLAQRELIPVGLTPWLTIALLSVGAALALRFRRV
ncbi:MAG: LptF/LptG family permease [bacterium]|nr:LptF/LptG family permease [bacterium]